MSSKALIKPLYIKKSAVHGFRHIKCVPSIQIMYKYYQKYRYIDLVMYNEIVGKVHIFIRKKYKSTYIVPSADLGNKSSTW